MSDVVIGIDIGTSSTKAVAVDAEGVVHAVERAEHGVEMPRPGWVEQDAEAIWWEQSRDVLRRLTARVAASSQRVRALAISGLGPCVLPCDAELRPLRPAILYGIDMRAGIEIDELTAELGAGPILARGGSPLTSQAGGPKLAWLRRHEPAVWASTTGFYSASSFLIARLTGEYVLDHHTASQFNPLYDLARADWSNWAGQIAADVALPRLVWTDEVCGAVHDRAAAATGLPVGLPVLGGTVDAWAEAYSVGVRQPGDLLLMYGSTMFLVAPSVPGPPHSGLWRTAGITDGSQSLAAGVATSGLLTGWLEQLSGRPVAELSEAAGAIPAGADGLLMLPYFAGERSPLFDPGARGVAIGLHLRHGPAHIMRAIYEATAMSVRHILLAFTGASPGEVRPPERRWRMTAAGGGTSSAVWMQIVSDVTGQPQRVPEQTIGASYGDALLAAVAVGMAAPGTDWTRTAREVEPRPDLAEPYDARFEAYLDLYPATRELIRRLG
jgi:xylulokinase